MTNSAYLPFSVSYGDEDSNQELPAQTRKRAVSLAMEAHNAGHKNVLVHVHTGNGKVLDETAMNTIKERLERPASISTKGGSLEAFKKLSVLSAISGKLSLAAKKAPLTDQQKHDLVQAMEAVGEELGLTE